MPAFDSTTTERPNRSRCTCIIDLVRQVAGRLPFSQIATLPASTLLGRGSAGGTGDAEPITLGSGVSMAGTTLNATGTGASVVTQIVNTQTGASATGTTQIPIDDTIPQDTEGTEFMTLAITPTSATNHLRIDVVVFLANSSGDRWLTAALFQDATAGALAAGTQYQSTADNGGVTAVTFTHYMAAGTTSATTFKVRAGANNTGTTTFNGNSGARLLGGVMASSITITECAV